MLLHDQSPACIFNSEEGGLGPEPAPLSLVFGGKDSVRAECIFSDRTLGRRVFTSRLQCVSTAVEPNRMAPRNSEPGTGPIRS